MQTPSIPSSLKLRRLNNRHQLIIDSVEALTSVRELPPMYWSANSAPIEGLSANRSFLEYLDSDNNDRLMPYEIIDAVQWLMDTMHDLTGCMNGSQSISITNFREDTNLGAQLKATAELVLRNLGKETHPNIELTDIQARTKIVQLGAANGDGILPASVLTGTEKSFVEDLLSIFGGSKDISGEIGVDEALLTTCTARIKRWLDWSKQCPSMDFTDTMLPIFDQVQTAIDEHFVWSKHPTKEDTLIRLTHTPVGYLRATDWVHPEYRQVWKAFWQQVLNPLSISELTTESWSTVWWMAHEHQEWNSRRPEGNFHSVPTSRLAEMCTQVEVLESLKRTLQEDKAVSIQLLQLSNLEKTLLYQQHLVSFLNSFVNFANFYNPLARSVPEIGSVLLDGRWFRLVVHVPNKTKHIEQAKNSGFFLLYLTVTLQQRTMDIAVAVTGSERGDLHIGKKGVFYDIHNDQFPAEVIHILDNPININEALFKPIEKLQSLAKQRLERFSKEQEQKLEAGVSKEGTKDQSSWMSGGVTLAALSSSFAYLVQTLTSIKLSSVLLVILAPLTILTLFSSLVAGWKLHRRDLGPILEASGWGINHPLRVPDWASQVFTLGAQVSKEHQEDQQDMLMIFEHTAAPYSALSRMLMWLVLLGFCLTLWWQWDQLLLFIDNLEISKAP